MSCYVKSLAYHCRRVSCAMFMAACLLPGITSARAEEPVSDENNPEGADVDDTEVGLELGALIILGADFRVYYRKLDSPWLYGVRFLNIEDDFINESAAGLPGSDSDREYTRRTGFYASYLLDHNSDESFYFSGALYNTKLKIKCGGESNSDSTTTPYFGGGFQGRWENNIRYNIGLLLAPFANLETSTTLCSSESSGDLDLDASLILEF